MSRVKRQRLRESLQSLLHTGTISNSGLNALLSRVADAEEGVTHATKADVDAAYVARYARFKVSESFPLAGGGEFVLDYAEPVVLLSELIADSAALTNLYNVVMRAKGTEKWNVVVAFDEYTPGANLVVDNRRKIMNVYVTFLDLGQAALSDSIAWVVPLVIRHSVLVNIVGGWPRVLKAFLARLLCGPHGLATAGMPLKLGDKVFVIQAHLACVFSDGEGLKFAFDWKGPSSLKPCVVHYNVFKKGSDLSHRRPGFCEIACADPRMFRSWAQTDMTRTMEMLNAGKHRVTAGLMAKSKLDDIAKSFGLNPNEHNLWTDLGLSACCAADLVGTITYDWVHSCLQDGTFTCEAWVFLHKCDEVLGVSSADVHAFLKDPSWRWPAATHAKSRNLHRVFDSYRTSSSETANKLKCSASELLGLYGMLRNFVEVKVRVCEALAAPRASFDAACEVLDVILLCKRGVVDFADGAAALGRAVSKHMTLHLRAYGDDHIKPKHHWLFHIGPQFLRDKCIIDAFVVERGHLLVKSIAEHVRNTTHFEASVMAGVTNRLFNKANVAKIGSGLRGLVSYWSGFRIAAHMTIFGLQVDVGDVVIFGDVPGRIVACAEDGEDLCVIVDQLELVAQVSLHNCSWREGGQRAVWAADQLEQCLAWRTAEGITTVIRR